MKHKLINKKLKETASHHNSGNEKNSKAKIYHGKNTAGEKKPRCDKYSIFAIAAKNELFIFFLIRLADNITN